MEMWGPPLPLLWASTATIWLWLGFFLKAFIFSPSVSSTSISINESYKYKWHRISFFFTLPIPKTLHISLKITIPSKPTLRFLGFLLVNHPKWGNNLFLFSFLIHSPNPVILVSELALFLCLFFYYYFIFVIWRGGGEEAGYWFLVLYCNHFTFWCVGFYMVRFGEWMALFLCCG